MTDLAISKVLVSTSSEYPEAAEAELRRLVSGGQVERLGPDLLSVEQSGAGIAELSSSARSGDLVFAKQLTEEVGLLGGGDVATVAAAADSVLKVLSDRMPTGSSLRVLAWSTGRPAMGFGPGNVAYRVVTFLEDAGVVLPSSGQEWIASIILADDHVHVGWNRTDVALTDWPGGRVRLARSDEQISRAEFKLEELFQTYPPSVPSGTTALDLGASPGGWTRIIRKHGLRVTAVDPGDLASELVADEDVSHARTTAGKFLKSTTETFDLIVNDMRMDPMRTVDVMSDAHGHLDPHGQVIISLKLGAADPTNLLRRARKRLSKRYTIRFIRQLHHNRHEVTVVATPN